MAWNDTTKQYEIETEEQALTRLLDAWNNQYPTANLTISNIAGTGLHGVFYTYIHGYYTFLQSGILDIQSKMTIAIKEAQQQVLRPNVVKDNIKNYGASLGADIVVYDGNDKKLQGLDDGLYFVFKDQPEPDVAEKVIKNCVVAGVKMQGQTAIDVLLSSGQVIQGKYTIATKIENFKIKIQVKRKITATNESSTIGLITQEIQDYYDANYKIGMDFNPAIINKLLTAKFNDLFEILCYYSLDEGLNWIAGGYLVPYNQFIILKYENIVVELLDLEVV